jgi:hypothetical protein
MLGGSGEGFLDAILKNYLCHYYYIKAFGGCTGDRPTLEKHKRLTDHEFGVNYYYNYIKDIINDYIKDIVKITTNDREAYFSLLNGDGEECVLIF